MTLERSELLTDADVEAYEYELRVAFLVKFVCDELEETGTRITRQLKRHIERRARKIAKQHNAGAGARVSSRDLVSVRSAFPR